MSTDENPRFPSDRALFRIDLEGPLPPFPGARVPDAPKKATLQELLHRLLDAAGSNVIAAPAQVPDPPSIHTSFAALEMASGAFEVAPGVSLAPLLWTHAAPLRKGEVARALRAAGPAREAQGYLALYALDVRSPLFYTAQGMPMRVRETIDVADNTDGPYIVLVACTLSQGVEAVPVKGYAQPIYHARRFVPVKSNLERDVLKALEHLQGAADAHGVEIDIVRHLCVPDIPASRLPGPVTFSLAVRDGIHPERRISICVENEANPRRSDQEDHFHVDRESFSSGAFVAWLERRISTPVDIERTLPRD